VNLLLLLRDELKGFYKSNVMLVLWIGMPLFAMLFFAISPEMEEGVSFSFMAVSILSGIGGFFASMMLTVYIIHEKSRNVFELFLIRPIKRWNIITAKFLAVFFCVTVACGLAVLLGIAMDFLFHGGISLAVLKETVKSFASGVFLIALECSGAVLIGVFTSSVLIGIVLVIVNHNLSSMTMVMPTVIKLPHAFFFSIVFGIVIISAFLFLAIYIFNRKQF